ncbi:F-box protein At2g17036-like [Cornus florida]|uniref:F-box protein At2g17036-like n=1 Tax=Cornus florida TaxID=4283 RepID=UPI00289C4E63|nr:F-box protein At2g17036-like [Cornus florida]
MPETFPKELNLLDFRITEIDKAYRLRFIDQESHYPFNHDESTLFKKVIVSSSPWSGAGDYVIMAIQYGKLWFFKLGDEKWTKIGCWNESDSYQDFVYHKGQFYAVGSKGRIVVIGSDLKVKPIASLGPHYNASDTAGSNRLRLVKSCGDLFLIDKEENLSTYQCTDEWDGDCMWHPIESEASNDPLNKFYLKVFKLNESEKKWERVGTLGDRVLFTCDAFSYSVSARDFSGLNGGCIYFSEGSFIEDCDGYGEQDEWLPQWVDIGVFSSVDGKFFHFTKYSVYLGTPLLLITRSAMMQSTSLSKDVTTAIGALCNMPRVRSSVSS